MPSVTVLLTPQVIGMRIFPELEVALKEAIFRVIGDMVAKENVDVSLQKGEQANSVEIVAKIGWKHRSLPSLELCEYLATESSAAAVSCIEKNFPGTAADIRTIATVR